MNHTTTVQNLWGAAFDYFGRDDYTFYIFSINLYGFCLYWLLSAIFLLVDFSGPKWILKYKVQPEKNVPVNSAKVWSACKTVLFNQVAVALPLSTVFFSMQKYMGTTCDEGSIPSIFVIIRDVLISSFLGEVTLYYGHRALHHPSVYKHIHKQHHSWTAPIGVVADYSHPIEHVMLNVIPRCTGPTLLGSHLFTQLIWLTSSLYHTIMAHCGYSLPYLASAEFHDFHHEKFNWNFGSSQFMDWFHGTDDFFRKLKGEPQTKTSKAE